MRRHWSYSLHKMRGHRTGPHSPYKMPQHSPYKMPRHRLCKMPQHRSGPCKSTDTSVAYKMRGQRSDPSVDFGEDTPRMSAE